MRKLKIITFLTILLISFSVYGTGGTIKQDSIIECDGKFYGHHGNPTHWHLVEKKNNKWVSTSGEVSIPACYIKKVNEREKVVFSKCGDGDTARFIINGEEKKVRFLAIDTPEVSSNDRFSKESSEYTCNAIKNAKEIYLEYDGNSDKEDKYHRILAFVYVDDVLLEKSLIENGLAKVAYIYGDYAHVDELKEAESRAKENKIGIWSEVEKTSLDEEKENDTFRVVINFIIELLQKIFALIFK